MTYQLRNIGVTISLADGSFSSEPNKNTLHIDNCRCTATSSFNGGVSGFTMDMVLYGLSIEQMGIISGTGFRYDKPNGNTIRIETNGTVFFEGMIIWSRPDFNDAPNIPLHVSAIACPKEIDQPVTDTNIKGSISLKSLLEIVGRKIGINLSYCSVNETVNNIALTGSVSRQLDQIREYFNKKHIYIDIDLHSISAYQGDITPDNDPIILTPNTGMVGYPTFSEHGLTCHMLYSPAVKMNKKVRITSVVPNASGDWIVDYGSSNSISSWIEGGSWLSNLSLTKVTT